ncbi:MAG: CBS domain-containing protein [Gammaproteobacteria bacterium]|nr:CBS domain-containing protein [Gammaproteobacteria bacterium]MBT8093439.1 CBS domain-containing protein [Gammaproteobacteria bacterium]MBT8104837.1 CBS domain-containing protein [Gammaproteobacteria bacterium]NNF49991.1 cyclic nucleotide-binding/CBS domain-containing protein [Woeseiaceae bacterium]NNK24851.1 cyclic nucleotide-binding/CBS domain-containing protein [Woeseiaceae bacterium]
MIEIPEITSYLRGLPGFERLDDASLSACARAIEVAYYRQGDDILTIGSENRRLHIIRSGAVELRGQEGDMLARLAEGEYFGFPSLMNDAVARNHSVAIEDTLVYHLDGEAFARARRASEDFDTWFIRALTDRLTMHPAPQTFRGASGRSVRTLISRPPVSVGPEVSVREATKKMVSERVSAMLVTNGRGVQGIITDRDIRSRVVAAGLDCSGSVAEMMTPNPISLEGDAPAYEAALVMMQRNIHHLPITEEGELVGMVSRSDFMRLETEHPLYLVADIGKQTTSAGVVELSQRIPALIVRQMESDASGEELGKFITTITDTLTRQFLRIAQADLGPPPCDFAWVALGSQGRFEQSAKSDQDNALVLSDAVEPGDDEYFAALAKVVNDGLNDCGYVYCPGDVMAVNPKWRQPVGVWKGYFNRWITIPEQKALMHANIFFDLRCVTGNTKLVDAVKTSVRKDARNNEIFLSLMAKNAMAFQPPLGFFRQFVLERTGDHKHTLDLKRHGIMPIVELARIRSLAAGELRINTRNRLRAAADAGEISASDAASLIDALDFIETLRIEHQGRQLQAGESPDNHLSPKELSPLVRQNLKSAFSQVRVSQAALLNRFHLA